MKRSLDDVLLFVLFVLRVYFLKRIAASLENIQQRNVVDKQRLLQKYLFVFQKRGIVHQIRASMSLSVLVVVISVFTDGAEPIITSGAGLIDGNPHVLRIASPVVVTIPIHRLRRLTLVTPPGIARGTRDGLVVNATITLSACPMSQAYLGNRIAPGTTEKAAHTRERTVERTSAKPQMRTTFVNRSDRIAFVIATPPFAG